MYARYTYRVARSLSTSLRSTSSAVSTSNRVLNSSASCQSRQTLLKGFGPRPSFGARPQPRPNPVLSLTKPYPLRSRGLSGASSVVSPPSTPHSMASRLCLMSSSCIAWATSGTASPDSPRSAHNVAAKVSGVSGERRSHSMWSRR